MLCTAVHIGKVITMGDKKLYLTIALIAILAISAVAYVVFTGNNESFETPTEGNISVTITSNPTGSGYIKVDGAAITTPKTFNWNEDTAHTLEATTSEGNAAETRYSFVSWSDGGSQTHTYTVTGSDATVSAEFEVQYKVLFSQTGLDSTAAEDIITFSIDGTSQSRDYEDLPFSSWVDPGTEVTYTIESNVSTACDGAFFMLTNAESSDTVSVNNPTTVTATYKRTIVDANGGIIDVPDPSEIERVADSWPAHNTIVVLCGAKNKLVATYPINTVNPMFQRLLPAIETMPAPFGSGTVNIEELLVTDPDVVFCSASGEEAAAAMENAGLVVVRLQFFDFDDMVHTVHLTGWVLGEEAFEKAVAYVDYFEDVQDKITSVVSQIDTEDKVCVLHHVGNSLDAMRFDAGTGLINTWINLCGGINAAAEVEGNMQEFSFEQILAWNPDMILIGSAYANDVKDEIMANELWAELDAVKTGNVVPNPMGVFDWSRYSVEEALNIQWVAKTLYPDLFSDIDIRAETAYFYETFYEYTLSEAEIDAILLNLPPP
jgi:iron complex transport system substrate-binding protein